MYFFSGRFCEFLTVNLYNRKGKISQAEQVLIEP